MDLCTDETIFSTTFHPNGTASTQVLRTGDTPSEDDRAWADAVRVADSLPKGADPEAHFAATYSASEAFTALVLDAYRKEITMRTVPGTLPRPEPKAP